MKGTRQKVFPIARERLLELLDIEFAKGCAVDTTEIGRWFWLLHLLDPLELYLALVLLELCH